MDTKKYDLYETRHNSIQQMDNIKWTCKKQYIIMIWKSNMQNSNKVFQEN